MTVNDCRVTVDQHGFTAEIFQIPLDAREQERLRELEEMRRVLMHGESRATAKKEPPTTACSICPKVFPAMEAYISTRTKLPICPQCFERAKKAGRAHERGRVDAP